ncbi:hypothetical protein ERJ75_001540000 [Trypanosoma vivax]|nr:hypothetical protein ERJ75_001540000 [Trypanosoma vivax]
MTRPNSGALGAWAGEQHEPSANGAAGEDACKGGPSELGVPTRGKALTGRPCPRTAACGADGTRRAQTHGPGPAGAVLDAGAGQQSRTGPEAVARRSVRTRDRWLCAAWEDRARGNGRGACKRQIPRPRGRRQWRRRDVDARSQERRRVWQAKKTNNASASRPPGDDYKGATRGSCKGNR